MRAFAGGSEDRISSRPLALGADYGKGRLRIIRDAPMRFGTHAKRKVVFQISLLFKGSTLVKDPQFHMLNIQKVESTLSSRDS
jgi:hypothetical protein